MEILNLPQGHNPFKVFLKSIDIAVRGTCRALLFTEGLEV